MKTTSIRSSRRKILVLGGLGTLALGLGAFFNRRLGPASTFSSKPLAGVPSPAPKSDVVTLEPEAIPAPNHETYSPLLNTDFTVEFPDTASTRIRLVEVTPIRMISAPKARYQCFSLFFEAEVGSFGEGGIARVTHPGLQPMNLFLSPVGRAKDGRILLEAAFTERA